MEASERDLKYNGQPLRIKGRTLSKMNIPAIDIARVLDVSLLELYCHKPSPSTPTEDESVNMEWLQQLANGPHSDRAEPLIDWLRAVAWADGKVNVYITKLIGDCYTYGLINPGDTVPGIKEVIISCKNADEATKILCMIEKIYKTTPGKAFTSTHEEITQTVRQILGEIRSHDYQGTQETVTPMQFLEDACTGGVTGFVVSDDSFTSIKFGLLYKLYKKWMRAWKIKPLSSNKFERAISGRCYVSERAIFDKNRKVKIYNNYFAGMKINWRKTRSSLSNSD